MIASGALLQYLHETQKNSLSHLMELKVYSTENYMVIDSSTRRNLELCETLREKGKKEVYCLFAINIFTYLCSEYNSVT